MSCRRNYVKDGIASHRSRTEPLHNSRGDIILRLTSRIHYHLHICTHSPSVDTRIIYSTRIAVPKPNRLRARRRSTSQISQIRRKSRTPLHQRFPTYQIPPSMAKAVTMPTRMLVRSFIHVFMDLEKSDPFQHVGLDTMGCILFPCYSAALPRLPKRPGDGVRSKRVEVGNHPPNGLVPECFHSQHVHCRELGFFQFDLRKDGYEFLQLPRHRSQGRFEPHAYTFPPSFARQGRLRGNQHPNMPPERPMGRCGWGPACIQAVSVTGLNVLRNAAAGKWKCPRNLSGLDNWRLRRLD